ITGGYSAYITIAFIAFAATGPGFVYERVIRNKEVTKTMMFLIDLAFWSAVIGLLYVFSFLRIWPVLLVMGLSALATLLAEGK
ncbi:MAG: hypothetical protein WCE45_07280, partial [Sedimentisphaerales bacterium]